MAHAPSRSLDWLARRARLSGSRVALVDAEDGGRETTYREWNARVNRAARVLRDDLGIRPGDRVALLAANSALWLDVFMACGKLGAVLQALNWRLPRASLARLVELAEPAIVVFDQANAQVGAGLGKKEIGLEALAEAASRSSPEDLEGERPALDDPWVLAYTGGTTGLPKAAILTHGNILWNAIGTAASWELHAGARALLNAPLFHTGGMNVFTTPLVWVGGASVVCRGFDVEQVFDYVDAGRITHLFGVPTMFGMMQAHARFSKTSFSQLEVVISGGAPCPEPIFQRFWETGVDFKTGYGLTEAGPNNFWLPRDEVRAKPGAVGYPLMHVEAKVVDEAGRCVDEPGVAGELLLRGPHVIPGYYRDPEATRGAIDEDGFLHTGDLALFDEAGCHRIVGRKKDMYISGGENVYPAEVESTLAGHPKVAQAAVIGVPDPVWGEVGRAFVVTTSPVEAEELLRWLDGRLAGYQRPRSIIFVDALPLTGAGKVDKRALMTSTLDQA